METALKQEQEHATMVMTVYVSTMVLGIVLNHKLAILMHAQLDMPLGVTGEVAR